MPKLLPDTPSITNSSEDAEKPNQNGMAAAEAEVKANAANAITKTPPTVDRARLDEYYEIEVRGFSNEIRRLITIGLIV